MKKDTHSFKEGVVKLIPIPITSGREVIRRPQRGLQSEQKIERSQSSVASQSAAEDWHLFAQSRATGAWSSLKSIMGLSVIFQHGPAIVAGVAIGLLLINWIEGLNDGARMLVVILSICVSEIVYQLLRKPHILVGAILGLLAMAWIDGLNTGAKLIVIFATVALSDIAFQFYCKSKKIGVQEK